MQMKKKSKSEFVLLGQPIIDINRQKVEDLLCEKTTQMLTESSELGEDLSDCMSRFFKQMLKMPEVRFANKICLVIELPILRNISSKEISALTDFMSALLQDKLEINYGIYYVKEQCSYKIKLLVCSHNDK